MSASTELSDYQRVLSKLVVDERSFVGTARGLAAAGLTAESAPRSLGDIASIHYLQSGGPVTSAECLRLLASVSAQLVPADTWAQMVSTLMARYGVGEWTDALAEASGLLEAGLGVEQMHDYAHVLQGLERDKLQLAQALFVANVAACQAAEFKNLLLGRGLPWDPELVQLIRVCHNGGLTADVDGSTGLGFVLEVLAAVPAEVAVWIAANRRPGVPVHRLTPKALMTKVSTEHYLKLSATAAVPKALRGATGSSEAWVGFWAAYLEQKDQTKENA